MVAGATVTIDSMIVGFQDAVGRHRLAVEFRRALRAFTATFEAFN
jgi:hypothetical protein